MKQIILYIASDGKTTIPIRNRKDLGITEGLYSFTIDNIEKIEEKLDETEDRKDES